MYSTYDYDDDSDDYYDYDEGVAYDSDGDYYTFTKRRLCDKRNKQGMFLKTFNWNSALSQLYNKEEKRSTFSDITVKVQTQIYHLNKAILALKSPYFETLFTGDYEDRNYDEIQIHTIDEETFSSIVDYIYGVDDFEYGRVMNEHNFAALFIAMDYLQMEINLNLFVNFLTGYNEPDDNAALQLYNFVSLLSEYESVTTAIHYHFVKNFRKVSKSSEFLSLAPIALIVGVLNSNTNTNTYSYDDDDDEDDDDAEPPLENDEMCEICVEWICHDFQKRLPYIIDLVNVVKCKFGIGFVISNVNYKPFEEPDETKRKKRVKKYFNKLLNHSVEIRPEPAVTQIGKISEKSASSLSEFKRRKYTSVRKIDYAVKWNAYFKQGNFCDISIRAGDEIFRLHRVVLSLEIPYFHDLLLRSPDLNEYVLEAAIDGETFRKIVNFMYYEEIDIMNERHIVRLLRSCAILRISWAKNEIYERVRKNLNAMEDILDFLSFMIENEEFHNHLDEVETFIEVSWEEIYKRSEFCKTSIDVLEHVISLPNLRLKNERDLLDICSEWIHYDVENRYQFVPRLAFAINRGSGSEVAVEKWNLLDHKEHSSKQRIEEQLKSILTSTQLVSTLTSPLACDLTEDVIPCFMILKDEEMSILNGKFDEIAHIPLINPIQEVGNLELSAAIVNDNLFTLLTINNKTSFQVYNICSKKVTSLTFNSKMNSSDIHLINYNDDLCFYAGEENFIWKYSDQLNRWIRFFNIEVERSQCIASNGKNLLRVVEIGREKNGREVQSYDFEKQSWVKYEHLTFDKGCIQDVSFTGKHFAILFGYSTALFRQELGEWTLIMHEDKQILTFKQFKDSIIYVCRKRPTRVLEKDVTEFHSFSIVDKRWQLKKEVSMKYKKIIPVHSV